MFGGYSIQVFAPVLPTRATIMCRQVVPNKVSSAAVQQPSVPSELFFFSLSCSLLVSHVRRLALAALLACVSSLALNPLPMAIRRQPAVAPHSVTSENDTVPRVLSPHRTRPSRDAELVHSGGVGPARFLGPIENCQA